MTFKFRTLSAVALVLSFFSSFIFAQSPSGVPTTYTTHPDQDGVRDTLTLITYEGENSFFSYLPENFPELDDNDINDTLLPLFDAAVANYRLIHGRAYPESSAGTHPAFPDSGKASIAIVTRTCGAGCGLGGKAEILQSVHRGMIDGVFPNPHNPSYIRDISKEGAWWIGLYELGRGATFDFYDELSYRRSNNGYVDAGFIANAFPQLLVHVTLHDVGLSENDIATQVLHPIAYFKSAYLEQIERGTTYLDYHPENGEKPTIDGMRGNDVMGVILYEFYLRYGKEALISFFDLLSAKGKAAESPMEATCNISKAMDIVLAREGVADGEASAFLTGEFSFPDCSQFEFFAEIDRIRFQSVLDPTLYINNELDEVVASEIGDEWLSADWHFVAVNNDFYRIQDAWNRNEFLHIEHGILESSYAPSGWWSGHWRIISLDKDVPTDGRVLIQNRWKPTQYMVIQNGQLSVAPTATENLGAQWTIINVSSEPTDPISIGVDGFESYASDSALASAWQRNQGGQTATTVLTTDAVEGTQAMQVNYDFNTYAGLVTTPQTTDWTGMERVVYWVRGDGSGRDLLFQFSESSGEFWEATIQLDSSEWTEIQLSFSAFSKPGWNSSGNGSVDLGQISTIAFYFGGQAGSGSIVIDNIALTSTGESSNTAPIANAGADQSVIASSNSLAPVTLDGTASFDADGDALTYTWRSSDLTVLGSGSTITLDFAVGSHVVELEVFDGQLSSNDLMTIVVEENTDASVNLAENKTVSVSSTDSGNNAASNAVDGNTGTRWSSAYQNNQWIEIDLGNVFSIEQVILHWETAYGSSYTIDVSSDGSTWTTVFAENSGNGGNDQINLGQVDGRYVRMNGLTRGTQWGFSLWEFEVWGN